MRESPTRSHSVNEWTRTYIQDKACCWFRFGQNTLKLKQPPRNIYRSRRAMHPNKLRANHLQKKALASLLYTKLQLSLIWLSTAAIHLFEQQSPLASKAGPLSHLQVTYGSLRKCSGDDHTTFHDRAACRVREMNREHIIVVVVAVASAAIYQETISIDESCIR